MNKLIDVPCFVINLKDRKDRWENMQKGLVNFNNVTRFDAVNVKNVELNELPISIFTRYIIDNNSRRCHHFQIHTKGAIGCSLSHISLWKKIVDNNIEKAIIFEDDCELKPNFFDNIQKCYERFDKDIFVFGYNKLFHKNILDDCFCKAESFFGSHAYLITNKGAKILLENSIPIELHIDTYIGLMIFYNNLEGLFITKNQINQTDSKSDIQTNNCSNCIDPNNNISLKIKNYNKHILIILIILIIILLIISRKNFKTY